jgi:hypothetical protein
VASGEQFEEMLAKRGLRVFDFRSGGFGCWGFTRGLFGQRLLWHANPFLPTPRLDGVSVVKDAGCSGRYDWI